jgi:predicted nicotinamide N-methyase
MPMQPSFSHLLSHHTVVAAPPLCPELRVHLANDWNALWRALEDQAFANRASPPFWAVAWPGGQALARFILDSPHIVRDCHVLDLGAGCGLSAIAAAKARARHVHACDIDTLAREVIGLNAIINHVELTICSDGFESRDQYDVILAGDVWYERFLARQSTVWLTERARSGTRVFVGDTGRAYFPRHLVEPLRRYRVPVSQDLEQAPHIEASVWQFH